MKSLFSNLHKNNIKAFICFALCVLFASPSFCAVPVSSEVPRTILALYKGNEAPAGFRFHPLHRFLEMPLNQLGLKVTYWNISKGLPDVSTMPPLRGIVSWFYADDMDKPEAYLAWAADQIKSGKKFLVIENLGAFKDLQKNTVPLVAINEFLQLINLEHKDKWVLVNPSAAVSFENRQHVFYEETVIKHPASLIAYKALDKKNNPYIAVQGIDAQIPVVMMNENGGFALENYMISVNRQNFFGRWFVDPFHFLATIFQTQDLPKLDVTTLNGRRIYFSHIDGDGWQNISQIEEYAKNKISCAEVALERFIKPFPDLPVTVAPIAADLDPSWQGTEKSQEIARQIFSQPQVQPASHTYSHPLAWAYYDNEDPAGTERRDFGRDGKKRDGHAELDGYVVPRAFFEKPFNLERELIESATYVQQFAPKDKRVNLLQWSGNCVPYTKAMAVLAKNGTLKNINGGDCRFDNDFPSYSSVCSVGRDLDGMIQIYAANSNENTYTNGWTEKFYAFKYLQETFGKTESPMRVKPINLYYHMYSAEKRASLGALLSDIAYVNAHNVIPIDTLHYAEMGEGFFSTRLVKEGESSWRILDRGKLQTIRFDAASDQWIDFDKSEGVMGGMHYQGSLYVFLDPSIPDPFVSLKSEHVYAHTPYSASPALLESRWKIWELKKEDKQFSFQAQGYGKAEMTWVVPTPGTYHIEVVVDKKKQTEKIEVDRDRLLKMRLQLNGLQPHQFSIRLVM